MIGKLTKEQENNSVKCTVKNNGWAYGESFIGEIIKNKSSLKFRKTTELNYRQSSCGEGIII